MASKMTKPPAKKVNVAGQEHTLAYINRNEARMLRRMGGSGKPGPSGIPTYFDVGEGVGGYGSGQAGDATAGAGDPDAGRSDGGTYAGGGGGESRTGMQETLTDYFSTSEGDRKAAFERQEQERIAAEKAKKEAEKQKAKDQLAERQRKQDQAKKSLLDLLPGKQVIDVLSTEMRDLLGKQIDSENFKDVVFDDQGKYLGNITENALGFDVFTGTQSTNYSGKYGGLVSQDAIGDRGDRIEPTVVKEYSGGKLSEDKKAGVNQVKLPDAPKPPGGVGDGEQTEETKKKSVLGQEDLIATSSQGLLSGARTRRRSLMSGLLT